MTATAAVVDAVTGNSVIGWQLDVHTRRGLAVSCFIPSPQSRYAAPGPGDVVEFDLPLALDIGVLPVLRLNGVRIPASRRDIDNVWKQAGHDPRRGARERFERG